MASAFRQYRGVSVAASSASGVPSMSIRKFSGIDSTFEFAERQRHPHDVFIALAHADDAAAAELQPGRADRLQRVDAIVVSVRRADLLVELGGWCSGCD